MALNFDRPLIIEEDSLFVNEIEVYFDKYLVFSKDLLESSLDDKDVIEDYFEQIKANIQGIKSCLIGYRNGHKLECSENFKRLMSQNSRYMKNLLDRSDSLKKSNNVFFRIRRHKVPAKEIKETPDHTLFHLPFKKRKFVGNGRFNSAGIPILYLSDCLKIPYLECDNPKTEFCDREEKEATINIGMFRNSKSFRFFDFSIYPWQTLIEQHSLGANSVLTDYLIIFPIVAAIHVKIKFDKEPSFHFDYVFSSLIMDWLKNLELVGNSDEMGLLFPIYSLKYSSVRLFEKMRSRLSHTDECYAYHNYAFSTKFYPHSSHCLTLESVFLKNGAHKTLYGDDTFLKQFKNKPIPDSKLKEIEELLTSGKLSS